ncbi:MAG TPA: hypothetical protein VGN80_09700 [Devosiaceae bacterium]|jgi:hypothetical protein|nr:hypothetical protein [Devosiaceae bacterium]
MPDDTPVDALAYIAAPDAIDTALQPYGWYKDFVMRGAGEHALPADYVAGHIECVVSIDDPDLERDRDERAKLRFR